MRALRLAASVAAALPLACGSSRPVDDASSRGRPPTSVEISELELQASGIDRFANCPPPGDLGQGWIPATASEGAHDPAITERAINDTLAPFRSCYHRGLLHDPSQDGRVAVVLDVGPDGKVAHAETWAACRLTFETLTCMQGVAAHLRFDPPASGATTKVVIPAVFLPRSGYSTATPTDTGAYTADAYLSLEAARGALHSCEQRARKSVESVVAQGTYAIEIDDKGRVVKQHVDPWTGNQELLGCAAKALAAVVFPPPPGGRGSVLVRIAFNPRSGTR
jgi:hypothetical protein